MRKGFFITVEGTDGSGKTTQFKLMANYLREKGFDVITIREPGGTPIGEKIRSIILDPENAEMKDMTELILYTASRAQLSKEVIEPALATGKLVLCDRFIDSSIAYQGYGRGLSIEFIKEINETATGRLLPDLTFFFDLAPEHALTRIKGDSDRLEKQSMDFHKRVYEGYLQIWKWNSERVKRIDCTGTINEVFNEVIRILDREVLI